MSIRLVVTITAAPGKGSELAQAHEARCAEAMKEPGEDSMVGSPGSSDGLFVAHSSSDWR